MGDFMDRENPPLALCDNNASTKRSSNGRARLPLTALCRFETCRPDSAIQSGHCVSRLLLITSIFPDKRAACPGRQPFYNKKSNYILEKVSIYTSAKECYN